MNIKITQSDKFLFVNGLCGVSELSGGPEMPWGAIGDCQTFGLEEFCLPECLECLCQSMEGLYDKTN